MKTYDVVFNNDTESAAKGWQMTAEYCGGYVDRNNGANISYFADFKGGTVQVVCNEDGEVVREEAII